MNYISLVQLQNAVTAAVATSPVGRGVWVVAELSDVRTAGGHCYMELIEKDSAGTTVARMRGTIWRNTFAPLDAKFHAAAGAHIVSGLKVLVAAIPQNHPLYGLSLNIVDIDPSYTVGDMERLRREILDRLTREGTAGRNRALPLPDAPQRIAVISAAGAAGYGDFSDQLLNNPDSLVFYPHLFQATMQGEKTSRSVRDALERIEMSVDLWDCVVIIRGGGATSDLAGFDDYDLARAVALFPLPVIVGIGHERDRTVLDEIAAVRCKTPTAVAAFLLERNKSALQNAVRRASEISRYAADVLAGEQRRIAGLAAIVPTLAKNRADAARQRLRNAAALLPALVSQRLDAECRRLEETNRALPEIIARRLNAETERLTSLHRLVGAFSPENTLRRGYSITLLDGKAVRSPEDVAPGTEITTRLASGIISSTVR